MRGADGRASRSHPQPPLDHLPLAHAIRGALAVDVAAASHAKPLVGDSDSPPADEAVAELLGLAPVADQR